MATEISTIADLKAVNNNLSADYVLVDNIDLTAEDNWTPLGSDTSPFTGNFEGQGYTISNLEDSVTSGGVALFGVIDNGTVTNLNLDGFILDGSDPTAILAGILRNNSLADNVNVSNCKINSIEDYVYSQGGIAGILEDSKVKNCDVQLDVEGYYVAGEYGYGLSQVGGIVGESAIVNNIENNIIENCTYTGTILADSEVGGIAGWAENLDIIDCHSEDFYFSSPAGVEYGNHMGGLAGTHDGGGNITRSYAIGTIPAGQYCGGLVGGDSDDASTHYSQCWSDVDVTVVSGYGAGLVGVPANNLYENCYAVGSLEGPDELGGLIGYADGDDFVNCYSACSFSVTGAGDSVGGIVANEWGAETTYENTYWDEEVANVEQYDPNDYNNIGEARTTAEMTDPYNKDTTYINWDFGNVWYIYSEINQGYPVLEEHDTGATLETIRFTSAPSIKNRGVKANSVKVTSPSAEYTAQIDGISEDNKIEKIVSIEEGGTDVCKQVAKALLKEWGKKKLSIKGPIRLNQGLEFDKKVYLVVPEGEVDGEYMIQKQEHDLTQYKTVVTAGDVILSDNELLARILDKIL